MVRKVLIADDDVRFAENVQRHLNAIGMDVRIAVDGRAAVETFVQFRPDAALLNVGLPDLNGFEVCQDIKMWIQKAGLPSAVFIFISASEEPLQKDFAMALGAEAYLGKPLDLHFLTEVLNGRNGQTNHRKNILPSAYQTIELSREEIERLSKTLLTEK